MDGRMRAGMTATLAHRDRGGRWPRASSPRTPSPAAGLLGADDGGLPRRPLRARRPGRIISDDTGVTALRHGRASCSMSVIAGRRERLGRPRARRGPRPCCAWRRGSPRPATASRASRAARSLGLPRWLWAGTDGDMGWLCRAPHRRAAPAWSTRGDLPMEVDGRHVHAGHRVRLRSGRGRRPGGGDRGWHPGRDPVRHPGRARTTRRRCSWAADMAPEEALFDDIVVHAGDAYVAPAGDLLASPAP